MASTAERTAIGRRVAVLLLITIVAGVLYYSFNYTNSFNDTYLKNGWIGKLETGAGRQLIEDLERKNDIFFPYWYNRSLWESPTIMKPTDITDPDIIEKRKKEFGKFSGDGEDIIAMQKYFHGFRNGLVLELGSLDGWRWSVSKSLEILFGWRSILIEADNRLAEENHINRPNAICIHAAICGEGKMLHYSPHLDTGVVVELASKHFLKSFHSNLFGKDGKLDQKKVDKLEEVKCVPLGKLLEEIGVKHINLFILDCEGCELSILQSLDFSKIQFDVISVETNRFGKSADRQPILDHMAKFPDYEVSDLQRGRNTWFKRKDFIPSPARWKSALISQRVSLFLLISIVAGVLHYSFNYIKRYKCTANVLCCCC